MRSDVKRSTVLLALLTALLAADGAAAEVRFGTAVDAREPDAAGQPQPHVGDIAQIDGGYDPADGSAAVSVAFHDQAPATFAFAFYKGRSVKRSDDCERRGTGPAMRGVVGDPTPEGGAAPTPSTAALAGVEGTEPGQTSESEDGRRLTATFKAQRFVDRGYRCLVVRSADPGNRGFGTDAPPRDRAEVFFLGFEPKPPSKPRPEPRPEPKPDPEPKPRPVRLVPKAASERVLDRLAAKYGHRRLDRRAGRYVGCPRSAFTRFRGRRTAFCLFRASLGGKRGVAGAVGVQRKRGRLRVVGFKPYEFRLTFETCELPGLRGYLLRTAGLLSCAQAAALTRKVYDRSPGRYGIFSGEARGFRKLTKFRCRVRQREPRATVRCANSLGDRVSLSYPRGS